MKKTIHRNFSIKFLAFAVGAAIALPACFASQEAHAVVAATHIYHNHMPNFWPYYDTSSYASTAVGGAIRYAYDGQAYQLKLNPPANYTYFLSSGSPMPHDDLITYYSHDAKQNAYSVWPAQTANANKGAHPLSQTQVTMSAAVINNIQSFAELGLLNFSTNWAKDWQATVGKVTTTNGFNALEPIHFTGHHSMGPLVGPKYFLKDLIFQNVTLQQDYFLGKNFKSSKGFFPTELGFSERLIPTLKKLGIEWSVVGNNHFSRTLTDYPYLNNLAYDTMVSPPNRADFQNVSDIGEWVSIGMAHEQQNIVNKFPFAAIPHRVQYVDPQTGDIAQISAIPVDQNGSWQEGWDGSATAADTGLTGYTDEAGDRVQYFVIAHDGDNSSGRAGSISTWLESGNEYSSAGVVGMGVQEYLKAYPIPANDVQHIQDGSWVDTRDSSSDPDWYHWHIPMGVWKGQISDFNTALGTDYVLPTNFDGTTFGHAVSMELGYHYLERNFALLQAAINYAETAEQIWLDAHPSYWSPTTDAHNQVTYAGNQLNPYMFSYPVKGDETNDYKGGANPAELGWYFLISSIDSGFGYYDENTDDNVKPSLGFNQSLYFTEPYVAKNILKDQTGPSMWWVQRYPTNPGSGNAGKAEGWTKAYADNVFAVYTYAYDVSGISDVKVYIREHKNKRMGATDIAPRVYEPKKFAGQANVDVNQVGEWKEYSTKVRKLEPDMNGVAWQNSAPNKNYAVLGGKKIGDTYYAYISDYRDQLVDYYMEATDSLGNVTKSEIQHVYVGAGRYKSEGGLIVEDVNGDLEGTHMFFTDGFTSFKDKVTVYAKVTDSTVTSTYIDYKDSGAEGWDSQSMTEVKNSDYFKTTISYSRDSGCADIRVHRDGETKYYPSADGKCLATGTYTIGEDGTVASGAPTDIQHTATMYFKPTATVSKVCMHYRGLPATGSTGWTDAPGVQMESAGSGWYKLTNTYDIANTGVEFLFNDCGSSWYKAAAGGNFTVTTIDDYNVNGTSLSEGAPEELVGTVNKAPTAKVSPEAATITSGETVTLDASGSTDSDGTIASYKWSTGETTSSIKVSPTATTTYTVTVTDNSGASASKSVKVTVESTPDIVVDSSFVVESNQNLNVQFKSNVSITGTDNQPTYKWSFGDGKTSTESNPAHIYTSKGTYSVTLTVTVDNVVNTYTNSVVVDIYIPVNANIVADSTEVESGTSIKLDGSSSTGSAVSYLWSTGETTSSITVTPIVTTTYKLTVTDANGTSDVESVLITVIGESNHAPTAKIVSSINSNTVTAGTVFTLDASSSSDEDGDDISYLWSTGENTAKISVIVGETTTYTVYVTDSKGAESSDSITINVVSSGSNVAPVARISPYDEFSVSYGKVYTLTGEASYDDKAIVSYTWKIDGLEVQSGNNSTLSAFADVLGEHTVSLTVKDAEDYTSTAYAKVTVVEESMDVTVVKAVISGPTYLSENEEGVFSAERSETTNGVSSYTWYVDNEKLNSNTYKLNYTFAALGSHVVTLSIKDSDGTISSTNLTVYVNGELGEDTDAETNPSISLDDSSDYANIPFVNTDGESANSMSLVQDEQASFTVDNMVGDIVFKVYQVNSDTSDSLSAMATSEKYTLCHIIDGKVSCSSLQGDDYVTVANGNKLVLTFSDLGNYEIRVSGTNSVNAEYNGYVPVEVLAETQTAESDSSSSKKSGGAIDPLALMGLAFMAAFLRRKVRK
jgi:hypothetical protein